MSRFTLIGFLALLAAVAAAVMVLLTRTAPDPVAEVPIPPPPTDPPPAVAVAPAPQPAERPAQPEVGLTKLPGHDDLKLVVDPPGPVRVYPGMSPGVEIKLVNTSRTKSHPVVRPGDGSEAGWCEPYTFLSATLDRPDGKMVELKREPYGRCGLYDGEWVKRVVTLKPGDSIPVHWYNLVPFDLQEEGTVTMRVHYRYAGRQSHKDVTKAEPAADRGGMGDVPPFEVVSDPIRVEVVRPLDLKLTLKRPAVKAGEEFTLPELLGLELTRRGDEPLGPVLNEPCYAGTVHLFVEVASDGSPDIEGGCIGNPAWMSLPRLEPAVGEMIDLFAQKKSLSENFNRPWKSRKAGVLRIFAQYSPNQRGGVPLFKSNPVELTITP